jgi:hypothetical protein
MYFFLNLLNLSKGNLISSPIENPKREKTKIFWDVSFGDYTLETHRNIDF